MLYFEFEFEEHSRHFQNTFPNESKEIWRITDLKLGHQKHDDQQIKSSSFC
jgi:hypothetical protein